MRSAFKGPLRFAVLALVSSMAVGLGPGVSGVRAADDMGGMEDLCAGDMRWMIGWCMDDAMAVESEATGAAAALAVQAAPQSVGVFEPIDRPGAAATRAFGINPQGDIVGSYTDGTGTHGYLLSDGVFTTVDYPGATTTSTEAWGINARGDIIGRYIRSDVLGIRGFLLSHGSYTDISIGSHRVTLPTKIGASGEVVGCFHDISGFVDMYGYVQRGSNVTLFARPSTVAPHGSAVMHNGVTPGGQTVVGLHFPQPGQSRGYVLSRDELTFLDFPGSTFTQAWDVNPSGTVVGQYDLGRKTRGFSYDQNGYVSIEPDGATATRALGINPEGDIVGLYTDRSGTHGFVLRR